MLRTFLQQGYEQFYVQTFDLAVAHLRLPKIPDSLHQALITVFKESITHLLSSMIPQQARGRDRDGNTYTV